MGGGERVAAVEGLQDPGDAAHLAVEIRAPVLRQRPQVLGRHPPTPLPLLPLRPQERGSKQRRPQGNPEMQEAAPLVVAGSKQVKKKKASSLAAPPHFPEEEVGDLTGAGEGDARASLTVSINRSRRPATSAASHSHSHALPKLRPPGSTMPSFPAPSSCFLFPVSMAGREGGKGRQAL